MADYIYVVQLEIPPNLESEFNRIYDDEHVPNLLKVPGVVSVIRIKAESFAIAIGGAAGQGIATPGNILARIFVRRGLHLNAYNAYQSIIRGGHIFLTIRINDQKICNHAHPLLRSWGT